MNLLDIAINSTENDYIDFKKQWYSDEKREIDMIHDIICLANSLSDKTHRYIFILQNAPLANIKNASYTEAIKNIGGVPYAPSQRKQEQDQDRKSNR